MNLLAVRLIIAAPVGAVIAFTVGLPFTLLAKAFLDTAVSAALASTPPGSLEHILLMGIPPVYLATGIMGLGLTVVTFAERYIRF